MLVKAFAVLGFLVLVVLVVGISYIFSPEEQPKTDGEKK